MMSSVFSILLVVMLLATVGALGFGLFTLMKGGEFSRAHSNQAMRWRILLQACALIIFFLLLVFGRG